MSVEQEPLSKWRFDHPNKEWIEHKVKKRKLTCSFCGYKFDDKIKPSKTLKQVQDEEKQRLKDEAEDKERKTYGIQRNISKVLDDDSKTNKTSNKQNR